jgi:hypothetical protein
MTAAGIAIVLLPGADDGPPTRRRSPSVAPSHADTGVSLGARAFTLPARRKLL